MQFRLLNDTRIVLSWRSRVEHSNSYIFILKCSYWSPSSQNLIEYNRNNWRKWWRRGANLYRVYKQKANHENAIHFKWSNLQGEVRKSLPRQIDWEFTLANWSWKFPKKVTEIFLIITVIYTKREYKSKKIYFEVIKYIDF